eukprot:m.164456 g.164456  ORF g.164456 m.164456 type:complete len:470 (+) comp12426_c0_seq1:249-1658(+)
MAAHRGPKLISRLYGHHTKELNDAVYVESVAGGDDGGIISIGEDKQLLIWLKRDSGGYWPSVHEELPAPATALAYEPIERRAYIGLGTGVVLTYAVQDDFNAVTYVGSMTAHAGRVTGICVDKGRQMLVTCGRDKMVVMHSLETNSVVSTYTVPAWVTAMDYDSSAPNIFVGDYGGRVHVLKVAKDTQKIQLIAALEGHKGSIRCIQWVRDIGMLFTGSYDKTVIMWDIGKCKGEFFTLRGHKGAVDALAYSAATKQLITAGSDKKILVWDVGTNQWQMAPEWHDSDNCQICEEPFFWNVQQMWDQKKLFVNRQHHCRYTGKAVCDNCSPNRVTICTMGFELPTRISKAAEPMLTEADKVARCKAFPLGNVATFMKLETMGREQVMITGSSAGEICIWAMGSDILSSGGLSVAAHDSEFHSAAKDVAAAVNDFTDETKEEENARVAHTTVYDTGYDGREGADLLSQLND